MKKLTSYISSSKKLAFFGLLLLLLLPAIFLLIVIDRDLGDSTDQYKAKKEILERNLNSVEVLILGSSNAYYGINPSYFDCSGLNLAINSQSPYYDYEITKKYVKDMRSLRLVILPAIYYTFGNKLSDTGQSWRLNNYIKFFGIPPNDDQPITFANLFDFPFRYYVPNIILYGSKIRDKYINNVSIDTGHIPSANGWYDSTSVPPFNPDNGKVAADAHSATFSSTKLAGNIEYWDMLIKYIKNNSNADVLILRLPEHETYTDNLNKKSYSNFIAKLNLLATQNNVAFHDYSKWHSNDQSYFTTMVDHMSVFGSEQFSKFVNEKYISGVCNETK